MNPVPGASLVFGSSNRRTNRLIDSSMYTFLGKNKPSSCDAEGSFLWGDIGTEPMVAEQKRRGIFSAVELKHILF